MNERIRWWVMGANLAILCMLMLASSISAHNGGAGFVWFAASLCLSAVNLVLALIFRIVSVFSKNLPRDILDEIGLGCAQSSGMLFLLSFPLCFAGMGAR